MTNRPNIVFFLVDDMGYGDVSCLNPEGKISTPNFDRLARQGMSFTDAHSTSAVCSPSRYSLLTGRYNWRSTLQAGIVGLYGEPLIAPDRDTLPKLLRRHGYHTACIGKWHLGMGWDFEVTKDFLPDRPRDLEGFEGDPEEAERRKATWKNAFSRPVKGGPLAAGFDHYFGVDVPNWPPYCFLEDDRVQGVPSEWLPARLLVEGLANIHGPAVPGWNFEQLLPSFASAADRYIQDMTRSSEPFFLYLPMTSPHTPLAVNEPWMGKSGLDNRYADFVMETDDIFGRVLDSLERHGIADNTLVIFASDNGCAHYIGADQLEARGHFPSGQYRGYKSDAWDGGHRIPFIARWPGVIPAGTRCGGLACLSDVMATCAAIVGETLPDDAGEDSISLMPAFRDPGTTVRGHVIHHSLDGKFAIRDRKWKLVLCPGSGGWSKNDAEAFREGLPIVQLYNMEADPGEKSNLWEHYPGQVRAMAALLVRLVDEGRSTPGQKQRNDAAVDIWKIDTLTEDDGMSLDDLG